MPGIALKYWTFQQTGWGNVEQPQPEPEIQRSRRDGPDWKWIGVSTPLPEIVKPPIFKTERPILTVLQFYTYTTDKFELNFRSQERLPFASQDGSVIFCEHISPSFAGKKLNDYLSETIGAPGQHTSQPLLNYDHIPIIGYDHQEQITLRWKTNQYREGIVRPNLPLSVSVNLRERHEYRTKSTVPLPWHIRTPILEYIRWSRKKISLPEGFDDEMLLAALAQIIVEIEENGEV